MASELFSAIEVRNAKPEDKPRKLRDGNGLNLLVHPNGSKYFQLRYTLHGKEKTLQLGVYPKMGLADARVAAKAARQLVAWHRPRPKQAHTECEKSHFRDQYLQVRRRPVAQYQAAHAGNGPLHVGRLPPPCRKIGLRGTASTWCSEWLVFLRRVDFS
jgi:hypothetical protein